MSSRACSLRQQSLVSKCPRASLNQTGSRTFSVSSRARASQYDETIKNLKIGKDTRVIFQGFTGKQATANATESIKWGTNIVGGVTPKKEGEHLGLPVYPTVRKAMEHLKPDATGVYVAAHQAPAAIEEAIEAEVPLIVAVAEHIPLHDILRIHSMLATQNKSRLVGANAPGIISSIGKCRIGFQPLSQFLPGNVGIVAKSGTLSYETVGSLTRSGVGQSLVISMGGDIVAGTSFVDALKLFENDDETEAIIICGEVGGTSEEEAAEWIRDYRRRTNNPKPIAALIGGLEAKPGKIMGHAGAWAGPGCGTAAVKHQVLQDAGVTMVEHPGQFGRVMKELMQQNPRRDNSQSSASLPSGRRSYHTSTRPGLQNISPLISKQQIRGLRLRADQATKVMQENGIDFPTNDTSSGNNSSYLAITVDRSARCPCITVSPTTNPKSLSQRSLRIPFSFQDGPTNADVQKAISHMQFDAAPPKAHASVAKLIGDLWQLFREKEAIRLAVNVSIPSTEDSLVISSPDFFFDDAACRSTGRHKELHAQRDTSLEDPVELSAEPYGIVYVKLDAPTKNNVPRTVGTLVNGAGLAMSTVDALGLRGAPAANFLDTGGKATSETVKKSFELILQDERVKVIFVNIFGGLTLGDMIARGVLLAFKELSMTKPVVVRIRGTNEKEGQKVIAESGLDLYAYDDFDEAVSKVLELSQA